MELARLEAGNYDDTLPLKFLNLDYDVKQCGEFEA